MIRLTLVLASLALLTACGATSDRLLRQSVGYECTGADGTVGGMLCSESDQPVGQRSRYCYATLGEINCLDRPDPDRQNAPVGSAGY
ncbi:MAG: hypothetical protein HN793_03840 [Rhodospirillaceae bacterium]|jgi:hypothetical protein|nr:hypothetical protein [Rhodospirillaceae bacterium]MBT5242131.1 hypothetical protein [Rhodospirillaceae bacterium]MBT5565857.1 hypothetical protein [Rhodospirillaceae bacterium]MBT6088721.1 hypothetical protein [Rhodospirillaceae bacterium]MBT6960817.1 hypothetical protein [Rhodospirillaceae bacterium]